MSARRWRGGRRGVWAADGDQPFVQSDRPGFAGSTRGTSFAECPRRGARLVRLECGTCGVRVLATRCLSSRCAHCAGYAVVPGSGPAAARSRVARRRGARAAPRLGVQGAGKHARGTILAAVLTVPEALRPYLATTAAAGELRRHARDCVAAWLRSADPGLVGVGGLAVVHPAGDGPGAAPHVHVEVLLPAFGVDELGRRRDIRQRRTLDELRDLGFRWRAVLESAAEAFGVPAGSVHWAGATTDDGDGAGDHPDTDDRRAVVHWLWRRGKRALHRIRYAMRPWGDWRMGAAARVSWWGSLGPAARDELRDRVREAAGATPAPACPTCGGDERCTGHTTRADLVDRLYIVRMTPDGQSYMVPRPDIIGQEAREWIALASLDCS